MYSDLCESDRALFDEIFPKLRNIAAIDFRTGDIATIRCEYADFSKYAKGFVEKLTKSNDVSLQSRVSRQVWASAHASKHWPVLQRYSRAWLSMRTGTAETERRFNYATHLLTSDRLGLTPDNLAMHLLIMGNNLDVDWFA